MAVAAAASPIMLMETPSVWRLSVDSINAYEAGNDCAAMDDCVQPLTVAHPRIYRLRKLSVRCLMHVISSSRSASFLNEYVPAGPDVLKCVYDSLRLACPEGLFEVDQACFGATANRLRRECTLYCSAQSACGEDEANNQECINECGGFETTQT